MALSFVSYTGNGTVTNFNITFPYINKTDVSVLVDEVSTSFTWLSASQISVSPAPISGSMVKIKRTTNQSSLEVDFVDSAVLTESDLDKANQQNFYLSQEAKDDSDIALKQNSSGNWEGQSKTLQNLGTPVNGTDAVNKTYIDTQTNNAFTSASNASTSEANALTSEQNAATSLDHFTDRYLGASATEPTTDLDGNQLLDGAMFWNSTDGIIYTYDQTNTSWVRIKPNATEQANITSAVTNASDISTAANNINDIRNFSEVYRISSTAPTGSLNQGDLWWDSVSNELKAYSAGTGMWQSTAPSTASQNMINIVGSDIVYTDDCGSIADPLTTGGGTGDITTVANNIGTIGNVANNETSIQIVGNSIANVIATGGSIGAVQTVSSNISSVNNVNSNISSVNTCAADISKIVDTANDLNEAVSEIDTCATNISSINAVGNDIANVNAVASDATDIGVVAGKATEIGLLGAVTSSLSTLGTTQVVSDLNSCASNASDISTVASVASGVSFFTDRYRVQATSPTTSLDSGDLWWDETNSELRAYSPSGGWQATAPSAVSQQHINNVSGALVYSEDNGSIADPINTSSTTGDVATVANGMSDINTVANSSNLTNINLVGADITNVGLVGNSIANVNTTAGITTEIGNVSAVASDVSTVSGIASEVSTVSSKATEVGLLGQSSVVTNLGHVGTAQAISDMGSCASNLSDIGVVAGVANGINFFTDRYRIGTSDPTTDNDAGDLFFNTNTGELRAYSTSWQATAPSAANQQAINNVSGALVYEDDNGSIADAISTSSSSGDIGTVSDNIDEVARLGTVQAVGDMQTLGTALNVSHLQTVSGAVSDVQTVSGSISDINRYAEEYTISSSAPSSPSAGDLWFDIGASVLKYRTSTTWASLTAGIAELVQDVTPELGAALDCLNNNINNVGTIDGSNLQIDFGSI
jgi:hypothetical protein